MPLSPPSFATPSFFGVADSDQFWTGIDTMTGSLSFQRGVFARHNLIAFEQSLGFLSAAPRVAVDILFQHVVPSGLVVLDDFGWLVYKPQRIAETLWFQARGYPALELPTGQGLVVKR